MTAELSTEIQNFETPKVIIFTPLQEDANFLFSIIESGMKPSRYIETIWWYSSSKVDQEQKEPVLELCQPWYSDQKSISFQNFSKENSDKDIHFIFLLRDPIFSDLQILSSKLELPHQTSNELKKIFYSQIIKQESSIDYWKNNSLSTDLCVKVTDLSFDKQKGFGTTKLPKGNFLLLRGESLEKHIKPAIKNFLNINIPNEILKDTPFLDSTIIEDLLQTFTTFKLPQKILSDIYSQPELKQVYSQNDLNKFVATWKYEDNQQEYQEYWRLQLAKKQLSAKPYIKGPQKVIIVAGLPRSGSTLLYNIALKILERNSPEYLNLGFIDYQETENFLKLLEIIPVCCLIKVHKWHPSFSKLLKNNAFVLFSYRDLRDSSVSAIQKGFIENKPQQITRFLQNCTEMSHHWECAQNVCKYKYEKDIFEVSNLVKSIADFIGITINNKEVQSINDGVNISAAQKASEEMDTIVSFNNGTVFDVKTQLHRGHIADGAIGKYKDYYSTKQIKLIEETCYHWLLTHGYTPTLYNQEPARKFFSKDGIDYVISSFFDLKTEGFFVDIGAFDGIYLSNSYSFELVGWKGICVEAHPEYAKLLQKNRPASINVECLVTDEKSSSTVFYCEDGGLFSSISQHNSEQFLRSNTDYPQNAVTEKKLAADTLNNILLTHLPQEVQIDFLSINVTGDEACILKNFDFKKYSPTLFIVSITDKTRDEVYTLLTERGYTLGYESPNNLIFSQPGKNIEKLRKIDINCVIEKQVHPLGNLYSNKEYVDGLRIVNNQATKD